MLNYYSFFQLNAVLCRTREKINRPQTRRRRDNSEELLDKMRLLKDNLAAARSIMDEVVRRERRKRDLAVRDEAGTPLPPCPPSLPLPPSLSLPSTTIMLGPCVSS